MYEKQNSAMTQLFVAISHLYAPVGACKRIHKEDPMRVRCMCHGYVYHKHCDLIAFQTSAEIFV